jgi:hypothetical protein
VRRLYPALLVLLVIGAAAFYIALNLNATGEPSPVMPLDDAYIHFQYARSIAEGHPYRYNPDQPPTSGATSLLYPYVLAFGYLIGFKGEALSWWALIIGVLSYTASTLLVYRIVRDAALGASKVTPSHLAFGIAAAFALSGSLVWAFVSGMETGLLITAVLLTLWRVTLEDRRGAVLAGTLATLIRPEGAAVGILTVLYFVAQNRRDLVRTLPLYALPFIAAAIQPLLNLALTGSITATGMQAKSWLYNVPADTGAAIQLVGDTIFRTVVALFTGSTENVQYTLVIVPIFAVAAVAFRPRRRVLLVLLWIAGFIAAVSLLETAFWQFKRYQQPIIALMFPMVGWTFGGLVTRRSMAWNRRDAISMAVGLVGLVAASLNTAVPFAEHYRTNAREVAMSQFAMARWVAANTPEDAIIGVHDIGVMRYIGNRTTYDVVGLTTPGAAKAWRQGPGAVYETMINSPYRPDYFAIYPDARGLTYFADTSLFGEPIARFPSTSPAVNAASATNSGQNVYRAAWQAEGEKFPEGILNIADLNSEAEYEYRWWNIDTRPGFATEFREMDIAGCGALSGCRLFDGGRLITGGEEYRISALAGKDIFLRTRLHPQVPVRLRIYVDGDYFGTRLIPRMPGQWLFLHILIPGELITRDYPRIRIEVESSEGFYQPYTTFIVVGNPPQVRTEVAHPKSLITFGTDGTIRLAGYNTALDGRTLTVTLEWDVPTDRPMEAVDAKTFVHVYNRDGELVAQTDMRPGNGTMPPANWLPGIFEDTYTLTIPDDVPPGEYQIALGLYDPETLIRLSAQGEGVESENRLFIGTITVD